MTMSVGDLLDEWFESDAIKGAFASTGVVGVWAGPRTPGTAYNLLHHALGRAERRERPLGPREGRHGRHLAGSGTQRRDAGATIRTGAGVRSIDVRDGRTTGVTLDSGEEIRAPLVVSCAHPRTTVLDLAGAEHFPDEVVTDMRRYRSRGGSVKINCILSEPPRYEGVERGGAPICCGTGLALCPSIDYLERAWQDAVRGEPAAAPYVEVEVPSSVDPSLTDDGTTVMTMFTQYGPYREEDWPEGAREAYAGRCLDMRGRACAQREGRAGPLRGARAARPRAHLRPRRTARSSRASRASTRWPSCAPPPCSPSTRRRSAGSICAARAPTPAAA